MDTILFPSVTVVKSTDNRLIERGIRKKFRFKGKVIHIRAGRSEEGGKTALVVTTDLSIKELESLKNKEVIILYE